jgi:hypothetical protein
MKRKFKPSIAKLTNSYGLADFFESRNYDKFKPSDFTEEFSSDFCEKSIQLQQNKFDEEKGSALKKYADLLRKIGETHSADEMDTAHLPKAIIPPYFYFNSTEDEWLEINLKLAKLTKEKTDQSVVPVIFTNPSNLSDIILDKYKDFEEIFIWVDDLEQKHSLTKVQADNFAKFAAFIKSANERNIKVINMYGSYFSIMLGKIGMKGMCNGIFYGETKGRKTMLGGVPQARFYIKTLHEFFLIPVAIKLLQAYPDLLDRGCKECMDLINGDINEIFKFTLDHSLAQAHFIHSRKGEIINMESTTLDQLVEQISIAYSRYNADLESGDIYNKNLEYLQVWSNALKPYC